MADDDRLGDERGAEWRGARCDIFHSSASRHRTARPIHGVSCSHVSVWLRQEMSCGRGQFGGWDWWWVLARAGADTGGRHRVSACGKMWHDDRNTNSLLPIGLCFFFIAHAFYLSLRFRWAVCQLLVWRDLWRADKQMRVPHGVCGRAAACVRQRRHHLRQRVWAQRQGLHWAARPEGGRPWRMQWVHTHVY